MLGVTMGITSNCQLLLLLGAQNETGFPFEDIITPDEVIWKLVACWKVYRM